MCCEKIAWKQLTLQVENMLEKTASSICRMFPLRCTNTNRKYNIFYIKNTNYSSSLKWQYDFFFFVMNQDIIKGLLIKDSVKGKYLNFVNT